MGGGGGGRGWARVSNFFLLRIQIKKYIYIFGGAAAGWGGGGASM